MYLRTLTLRGFKSFASATTLTFEPGITCVVGPNGSGKSNVVDALAWVMGEQGAKSLRGGAMADVIFAGTTTRPALGRAEVSLTIDNSDGALPIDYTEVTISRTMFASGGSEYAINATPCRLLDIQELLSDSGLGRQMHVIVGQGQLDAVLRATPEERRGFIEEAAGILKHRRRKERALRKLDQVAANLARLTDLVTEIRRQLGPLAKQAEVARKAAIVQADLRDARSRLLADDLAAARAAHEQESADVAVLTDARTELETDLGAARDVLARSEAEAARLAPALAEATETWYRLSGVRERLRGTATLAQERSRLLGVAQAQPTGPDPDDLDAQTERARAHAEAIERELAAAQETLAAAVAARREAEAAALSAEKELAAVHRAVADRREGLARLVGQVGAVRSRLEAQSGELERLAAAGEQAARRRREAEGEFAELELQAAGFGEGEEGLDKAHEAATARLAELESERELLAEQVRQASAEADRLTARSDALALSLQRGDAAGVLLSDAGPPGVLGALADQLTVAPGWEGAIAAALGPLVDAVLARDEAAARHALGWVREREAGRAVLVFDDDDAPGLPGEDLPGEDLPGGDLPEGCTWAVAAVRTAPALARPVRAALAGVALVPDLAAALDLVRPEGPGLRLAVTREGDVASSSWVAGGTAAGGDVLALSAAREEALAGREQASARADRARFALKALGAELEAARGDVAAALGALHESDAAYTAVAERLGRLSAAIRAAKGESERSEQAITAARAGRVEREQELAQLTDRLERAQAEPSAAADDLDAAGAERDAGAERARAARGAETDARLVQRTVEERQRAAVGRVASLERAARTEREARARAEQLERRRRARALVAERVRVVATQALALLEGSLARACDERDQLQQARGEIEEQLSLARERADHLATRLAEVTAAFHRDELARAEHRLRMEELQRRSLEELALDPEVLLAEFGPHAPVPVLGVEPDAAGQLPTVAYDRGAQEKRLRAAERALALLGRVNPLALEEHAALEERHAFLVTQVADVRKSRADLLEIVREIDDRVQEVFTQAWADTEREFRGVFARLFPGGEGRLVLTDPGDMLQTGVDVEARPPGKKIKRLSLLSGGERSLTAVALLVAIFKARPSPFYVMDEVEAALDDTNLGRLLEIFTELREDSQLIVITHQKRTMEVADALYGVAMKDGVSAVISQRLDRGDPLDAPRP